LDAGVNPEWLHSPRFICQCHVCLGVDCPRRSGWMEGKKLH